MREKTCGIGGSLEERQAENLQDCVERMRQVQAFSHDGHEYVNGHGDPDLGLHAVGGGAVEAFDLQVLLDPLEEELDLPAIPVQCGDGRGSDGEIVGEKDKALVDIGRIIADAPQGIGIESGAFRSGENDGLVAANAGCRIDELRVPTAKLQVLLPRTTKKLRPR
jgi:hypothetical protein